MEKKWYKNWKLWTAVAVCLAVALTVVFVNLPEKETAPEQLSATPTAPTEPEDKKTPEDQDMTPGLEEQEHPYAGANIYIGGVPREYDPWRGANTPDLAILWPEEYTSNIEKYTQVTFEGREYRSRSRGLMPADLGEKLGTARSTLKDKTTGEETVAAFDVYAVKGVSREQVIGVDLHEMVCVFTSYSADPPAALGQFIAEYDLAENLTLKDALYVKDKENDEKQDSLVVSNTDFIWEILQSCGDAERQPHDHSFDLGNEFLTLRVESENLGIYRRSFQVSRSGYLRDNAVSGGDVYSIGPEAAGKLIDTYLEKCTEGEFRDDRLSLKGEITEITEDFIYINDAYFCIDPADAITFKVSLRDMRIRRFVEQGYARVGTYFSVDLDYDIDVEAGYVLWWAENMMQCYPKL